MTNEERDIIAAFIARVGGAAPTQSVWGGASVPATQSAAPALPPVDPEADAFITQQFQANPEARYRLTQLAFVQEHALVEAQNRLRRAEWELQQAQQSAPQSGGPRPGGFLSGLFGGGARQGPAGAPGAGPWGQAPGRQYAGPPPPQYPPGYQPGAFQRAGGSGFLGSALTTAAGVAGGVLAADAIRSMFSPHEGFGGGMGGGFGATPGVGAAPDQGYVDQGTWDQGAPDQSNWNDPGSAAPDDGGGGGGWDQGSSGGGDWGGDSGGGDSGGDMGGGGDDSLT